MRVDRDENVVVLETGLRVKIANSSAPRPSRAQRSMARGLHAPSPTKIGSWRCEPTPADASRSKMRSSH
jgi:hypothetical protein